CGSDHPRAEVSALFPLLRRCQNHDHNTCTSHRRIVPYPILMRPGAARRWVLRYPTRRKRTRRTTMNETYRMAFLSTVVVVVEGVTMAQTTAAPSAFSLGATMEDTYRVFGAPRLPAIRPSRSRLLRGRLHSEQTPAAGLFKSAPRAPLKTSCLARYAFELRVFPNRRERRGALDRAQRRESLLLRAGQHFDGSRSIPQHGEMAGEVKHNFGIAHHLGRLAIHRSLPPATRLE